MERRKFVVGVGTAGMIALAGCSDGGGGPDTDSPEGIVESFYEAVDGVDQDASSDELLDEIDGYLHSASPLRDLFEEQGDDNSEESEQRNLDSVSASVVEENIGSEALNGEYGLGILGVSEGDVDSIAEENAVVEAEVEYEDAETETQQHLTATDDGDWLIVF